MAVTRRQFVITAVAGLARRVSDVRIRIVGSLGRRGAELGVDEMTRTATLLGRTLHVGETPDAVTIDLNQGRLLAAGATFHVAASEAARYAALSTWRKDHAGDGDAAVEWHPDLEKFGAGELNERFSRRYGASMDAAAWIGWMLVKIPVEAALRRVAISGARFDGHKGVPLTFGPDNRLIQPLCILDSKGGLLGMSDAQVHK